MIDQVNKRRFHGIILIQEIKQGDMSSPVKEKVNTSHATTCDDASVGNFANVDALSKVNYSKCGIIKIEYCSNGDCLYER